MRRLFALKKRTTERKIFQINLGHERLTKKLSDLRSELLILSLEPPFSKTSI